MIIWYWEIFFHCPLPHHGIRFQWFIHIDNLTQQSTSWPLLSILSNNFSSPSNIFSHKFLEFQMMRGLNWKQFPKCEVTIVITQNNNNI